MTATTSGGCLCGKVRYEVSGEFQNFFLCHCSRCRKDTGSAHAANLFSTTATLAWLAGKDAVKAYRVPGSRHERAFCGECGSAVPGLQLGGRLLVVPAGSVETPIAMRPTGHVCFASRADWDEDLGEVRKFEALPG